ncbi:MAG: type I glyceraldehyde-3-phosphate dehydrogenase [Epsilonproteobacteria bacterium]|nr:type I glyceraldehyde-3-phosphate dehydrogenase [Campylobacterota bacterium]
MKIAINGFGRIGRNLLRAALKQGVDVVAINDIMPLQNALYLAKFDTIRGGLDVKAQDNGMICDGKFIRYSTFSHPKECEFGDADVVIECSGRFLSSQDVKYHLDKGAKRVIISAPASDDTPTFVLGVNHNEYNGEKIISNASCTTNCLAPIAKVLDTHIGIKSGFITTVHSYTMDQKLLDSPNLRDIRRSRAACSNIIPTFTGAAKAIYKVLPNLKGKLDGRSVRVPVNNVSLLDFAVMFERKSSVEEINSLLINAAENELKGIVAIDNEYKVSSDINGASESAVVAVDLTQCNKELAKIFAWYDNEWGYANRLVEMAKYILKIENGKQ